MGLGEGGLAATIVKGIAPITPLREHVQATCKALLEEADGEHEAATARFADAAAGWHDFGAPYEEAQALLGQGRCLVALGRASEAAAPLTDAREILARLGAKPALAEVDRLLEEITSAPH